LLYQWRPRFGILVPDEDEGQAADNIPGAARNTGSGGVEVFAVNKKKPHHQQSHGTFQHMPQQLWNSIAFFDAVGNGIRNAHAYNEKESGEYRVRQAHAVFFSGRML